MIWKWRDVSSVSYQELALGYWSRMVSESSVPMESCPKASRSKEKHDKGYTVKNISLCLLEGKQYLNLLKLREQRETIKHEG